MSTGISIPMSNPVSLAGDPRTIIAAGLEFKTPVSQKWWDATAPILENMLKEAGHDVHSQYRILLFYHRFIIPHLGPFPELCNGKATMSWNSFMTDDHSPMELSWAWERGQTNPKVRFSVEAIGSKAGSESDPFNQIEALTLLKDLKRALPHLERELFDYFQATYERCDNDAVDYKEFPYLSSIAFGFDCSGGMINVGAYMTPPRHIPDPQAGWTLTYQAISEYSRNGVTFPSSQRLHNFLTTSKTGRELCFMGIGIDCVRIDRARLKIYVRSQRISRGNIRDILTMQGSLKNPWTDEMLSHLYTLIDMVAPGMSTSNGVQSLTSGLLYNFDIHGAKDPYPRVYIPVRHYGRNDLDIAENLERFRAQKGMASDNINYVGLLEKLCDYRKLGDDKGLQTYIAISPKGGEMAITAYVSPQVYTRLHR